MKKYDFLIVGAGFSGSVLAERLATKLNKKILVIDKRDHIGGNAYDKIDEAGVLIHRYGPHYFRTSDMDVFNYLSNFTDWHHHEYKVKVWTRGKLFTFPINLTTLEEFFDEELNEQKAKKLLEKLRDKDIINPKNAEEQVVSKIGWDLYEAFFKEYTEKQWGRKATELDSSVTARIPIRTNRKKNYVTGKVQALPKEGYTTMFEKILNHPNITVKLNTLYKKEMRKLADYLVWTGCIDQYFNYKFGKLPYRSLKFKFKSYCDKEYYQDCEQINYPSKEFKFTRIVEIKHATGQKSPNTTICIEYPKSTGDPYYPIPNIKNQEKYKLYEKKAEREKKVFFLGRLANYKYYNMDQVVKKALDIFEEINEKLN